MKKLIFYVLLFILILGQIEAQEAKVDVRERDEEYITVRNRMNILTHAALSDPAGEEGDTTSVDSVDVDVDVDVERRGPNNIIEFDVYTEIDADMEFSGLDVLSINKKIFRDDNINSGYYYYRPNEYNIYWEEETSKYGINVNYGMADESSSGRVTVTAILVPNYNKADWEITKHLLSENLKRRPEASKGITDLVPIPFNKSPGIEFDNLLQYGVNKSDITMRVPEDLFEPILLSFTTDRIEELMNIFFGDNGLFGNIIIYPAGEEMSSEIKIPFTLKIDSPKTFGRFTFNQSSWRSKDWQNKTDFPIILKYLHVLRKVDNGGVNVYSWETGDTEIPENARIKFNHSTIPSWVDTDANVKKIWLEYSVKSCHSCNIIVESKIDKGVSGTKTQQIEIINLNGLSVTGGEMMKITIRSVQASSSGSEKKNLPSITITEDPQTVMSNPLFLKSGEEPDFEYKIKIYRTEGEPLESNWLKSNELDLFFNESALRKILPDF